ncbi:MAG: hypothetical protein FJ221_17070 [Lentisphaerae bacterium]|nr:hypothetical protein [Lentisphaerota bacterium]
MSETPQPSPAEPAPVLRVNGETVPAELVRREEDLLRRRYAENVPEAELASMTDRIAEDARQNAIERILLLQTARSVVGPVAPALVPASRRMPARTPSNGSSCSRPPARSSVPSPPPSSSPGSRS